MPSETPPGGGRGRGTGPLDVRAPDVRALHPVSIVIGVPFVQLARTAVVPIAAVFAGGADLGSTLLLAVLAGGLAVRILAWQRFRWSFDGQHLRVDSGVLSRTRRSVGVDRIQQVELDRPFAQRLLGVATLRIETAGPDTDPEVELRVLRLAEASELRAALQTHLQVLRVTQATDLADPAAIGRGGQPQVVRTVIALPLRRVALASVTGAQLLIAPALLVGALQFLGERTDDVLRAALDRVLLRLQQGMEPTATTWVIGLASAVMIALVTTLVVSVVRDGGFTITRVGDDLVIRRGLLGTRESTVPLRRVQVVRVVANPVRRLLGVASVRIHSAGGSAGGERRVAIPLVGMDALEVLLGEVVEGLTALPTLAPHPVAARRRAFLRRLRGLMTWWIPATVGWVVLITVRAGGADLWLPTVVVWAFDLSDDVRVVPLVVVVAGFVLAWLFAVAEHRALAHGHDDHVLAARHGPLVRTLSIAPLMRLQAVTFQQSVLQARRGLATVVAHVAGPGGDVTVLDAGVAAAHHLRDTLAAVAAGTLTAAAAQGTDGTGGIAGGADGVGTVSARS